MRALLTSAALTLSGAALAAPYDSAFRDYQPFSEPTVRLVGRDTVKPVARSDPHAGHAMHGPAADPHAGHAGHAMHAPAPAAKAAAHSGSHSAHAMHGAPQQVDRQTDPHAGHGSAKDEPNKQHHDHHDHHDHHRHE